MAESFINFDNVSYTYQPGTPFSYQALHKISLEIHQGDFVAVVGHTGSGKSTLMQLLDGLLLPSAGSIHINDRVMNKQTSKQDLAVIRQQIGFVFQFPESQLFADTVLEDVMFGPRNQHVNEAKAKELAIKALRRLNFSSSLYDKSPFELSGGQMRRVAIAGVIAMDPDILILDEPTAGLDPNGQQELMQLVMNLHKEGKTIILITHQMEQVAELADRVVALYQGELRFNGTPGNFFQNQQLLKEIKLSPPRVAQFANQLRQAGFPFDDQFTPLNVEQLAKEIARIKRGGIHRE